MISKLILKNFKCFSAQEFSFRKLSVIAGENASGKSSVLQALLLLQQALHSECFLQGALALNGDLVALGTVRDILYANRESDELEISYETDGGEMVSFSFNVIPEQRAGRALTLSPEQRRLFADSELIGFSKAFNYLSADRLSPQNTLQIKDAVDEESCYLGKLGEYWEVLFAKQRNNTSVNQVFLPGSVRSDEPTELGDLWHSWMRFLFPGFRANVDANAELDLTSSRFAVQTDLKGQAIYVRPRNTGFGLYYVSSVILAGLITPPGGTFYVENPEAHLHPSAQSKIGQFMALVSEKGPQVFVETHSDHVVNGIRKHVTHGDLLEKDVVIIYVSRDSARANPSVIHIHAKQKGELDGWPAGFMDQTDKDLTKIYTEQ